MKNKFKKINLTELENKNFISKGSSMYNKKFLKRFKIERSNSQKCNQK